MTFGSGTTGVTGVINTGNSAIGLMANSAPGIPALDNVNNHFIAGFPGEGKVRLGSQVDGFAVIAPEIVVTQAAALTDGVGSVAFGTVVMGGSSAPLTFTITNTGSADLTGLAVTMNGANATDFTVSALSSTSVPVGAGTATFIVTFSPGGTGARTAALHIASNDADENPFDIALTGTGTHISSTLTGGALVITDGAGGNDTFSLSQSGSNLLIGVGAGTIIGTNAGTGDGTNSVSIPLASITGAITVNAGGGTDIINIGAFSTALAGLTVNGGTGNDTVNFNGDITFTANGNLDVDLQNDSGTPGTDIVNVAANANLITSGTGTITVRVSKNVAMAAGSSFETVNGGIIIEANLQAVATSGTFIGINNNNGLVRSTGTGQISVNGRGGNTATDQYGVLVFNGGDIIGGTSGTVTVQGTGGATSIGQGHLGVYVTGTGSSITSNGASVLITGIGGGGGATTNNDGVAVTNSAIVNSGGAASTVTIIGTGGPGSGGLNQGVWLGQGGTTVSSGGGNVKLIGVAGTGGASNFGIFWYDAFASVTTATNGGNIVFAADTMKILGTVAANASSSVTLRQANTADIAGEDNGDAINLGSTVDTTANTLELSAAELDLVTAGTIQIGDANSGAITVGAAIAHPTSSDFALTSGSNIIFNPGTLSTGGGSLTLTPGAAGSVQPLTSGIEVTTSAATVLAFGSGADLAISILGPTADTQYTQLNVAGLVDLTGADLVLSGAYVPTTGDSFIIVNNDGTDAITGTFNGLPEGSRVSINGVQKKITYVGGAGSNDVVLAPAGIPPVVVTLAATSILPTGAVLNGTANPNDLSTDAAFEIAINPAMTGAVVTSSQNIGNGFAAVPVSFPVTGLASNTTYYFRIIATNAAGTSYGTVYSFLTPVIVWGGAGANAGTGILDATRIPADTFTPVPSPLVFTNVAGHGYDISTTTYRLGAVGPATFPATVAGSPAWFFQGSAPNNSSYSAFTFRFFKTGTSNPVGVTGIRFRIEDAETGERFANFSYWDAIGNKITVPFTDSMFVYSNTPTYFNNGYGVINGAGYEGGTQTGKWIDIDLSLRAISGFELLSHRQTSSAGSVIMTGWGGGPQPMNVWRQAQFGGSWTDDSISGDFADPNRDGVINLLAYAFGIPPLGRTSGGLPVVSLSGGYLTVAFNRPLSVTDLTYLVEVSSDMTTWLAGSSYSSAGDVPANVNTTQLSRTADATTETLVVRDNTPASGSRYIRVRVTRP